MEKEEFDRSLKAFNGRTPFHPFFVELVGGGQLQVDRPEALVFRNTVAVHFDREGVPTLFDHLGVARMIGTGDAPSSG